VGSTVHENNKLTFVVGDWRMASWSVGNLECRHGDLLFDAEKEPRILIKKTEKNKINIRRSKQLRTRRSRTVEVGYYKNDGKGKYGR